MLKIKNEAGTTCWVNRDNVQYAYLDSSEALRLVFSNGAGMVVHGPDKDKVIAWMQAT